MKTVFHNTIIDLKACNKTICLEEHSEMNDIKTRDEFEIFLYNYMRPRIVKYCKENLKEEKTIYEFINAFDKKTKLINIVTKLAHEFAFYILFWKYIPYEIVNIIVSISLL